MKATTASEMAEIASFIDTGETITHRGREYAIFAPPADETRADSPYILRSKRGRYFALTRNRPRPHLLFGIALYGRLTVLPGWFSDQSGTLVSLG